MTHKPHNYATELPLLPEQVRAGCADALPFQGTDPPGTTRGVTVCAKDGTILDMNAKSKKTFLKPGMPEIIGNNVLDCHPEPARSLLADMLENPRTNVYTVEKEGVKKLIFQTPWYDEGEYAGFMELSMVLPEVIPNRVRKPKP